MMSHDEGSGLRKEKACEKGTAGCPKTKVHLQKWDE